MSDGSTFRTVTIKFRYTIIINASRSKNNIICRSCIIIVRQTIQYYKIGRTIINIILSLTISNWFVYPILTRTFLHEILFQPPPPPPPPWYNCINIIIWLSTLWIKKNKTIVQMIQSNQSRTSISSNRYLSNLCKAYL